jgi:hypothetical protein
LSLKPHGMPAGLSASREAMTAGRCSTTARVLSVGQMKTARSSTSTMSRSFESRFIARAMMKSAGALIVLPNSNDSV